MFPRLSVCAGKISDPFTLKKGDVITFMPDEDSVVTHRIAEAVPEEDALHFYCKYGFTTEKTPGQTGYSRSGSDSGIPAGNRFMNHVSSNYPDAEKLGLEKNG